MYLSREVVLTQIYDAESSTGMELLLLELVSDTLRSTISSSNSENKVKQPENS